MNIPTPRTDAEANKPAFSPSEWIEFTRSLERELIAALAKIEEMETDAYNSMVERSLRDHD